MLLKELSEAYAVTGEGTAPLPVVEVASFSESAGVAPQQMLVWTDTEFEFLPIAIQTLPFSQYVGEPTIESGISSAVQTLSFSQQADNGIVNKFSSAVQTLAFSQDTGDPVVPGYPQPTQVSVSTPDIRLVRVPTTSVSVGITLDIGGYPETVDVLVDTLPISAGAVPETTAVSVSSSTSAGAVPETANVVVGADTRTTRLPVTGVTVGTSLELGGYPTPTNVTVRTSTAAGAVPLTTGVGVSTPDLSLPTLVNLARVSVDTSTRVTRVTPLEVEVDTSVALTTESVPNVVSARVVLL